MEQVEFYCRKCKKFFEEMWKQGTKVQCPNCKTTYETDEMDGEVYLVSNSGFNLWKVEPLVKGLHPCFYQYSHELADEIEEMVTEEVLDFRELAELILVSGCKNEVEIEQFLERFKAQFNDCLIRDSKQGG